MRGANFLPILTLAGSCFGATASGLLRALSEHLFAAETPSAQRKNMPGTTVDRILDELVPVNERGAKRGGVLAVGGGMGETWQFENVTTFRTTSLFSDDSGEKQVIEASVRWKPVH